MENKEHSASGGASPLWYAIGAIVLILAMMAGIARFQPLDYKSAPPPACEGAACAHEGAPSTEHEGTSRAAPPASHDAAPGHGE